MKVANNMEEVSAEKVLAGKIDLFRALCPKCGESNLSGKLKFECDCGCDYEGTTEKQRILANIHKRRNIPPKVKKELLEKQKNRCYWCERKLGNYIFRKNRIVRLNVHIDHFLPVAYRQMDNAENLTATCHICNLFKSSKMFDSERACKNYILDKWAEELYKGKIIEDWEENL